MLRVERELVRFGRKVDGRAHGLTPAFLEDAAPIASLPWRERAAARRSAWRRSDLIGPFRGDKDVMLRLFPARSIEDGVQEGGGARTPQHRRHRSDCRSPSTRPAIVHPAITPYARNVPVARRARSPARGPPSAKDRTEPPDRAGKRRRCPDEALILVAGRVRLVDAIVRQAENAADDRRRPDRNARQNDTELSVGDPAGSYVCDKRLRNCPRPGFGRRYYLLRLHKDRAVNRAVLAPDDRPPPEAAPQFHVHEANSEA
jgi:hypothetical protein